MLPQQLKVLRFVDLAVLCLTMNTVFPIDTIYYTVQYLDLCICCIYGNDLMGKHFQKRRRRTNSVSVSEKSKSEGNVSLSKDDDHLTSRSRFVEQENISK